jgi:hypothetical protein
VVAEDRTFDLFPARYGSGWVGVHVAVKETVTPPGMSMPRGVYCIGLEAENADELDAAIDQLIEELQELKAVGRRKMRKLTRA